MSQKRGYQDISVSKSSRSIPKWGQQPSLKRHRESHPCHVTGTFEVWKNYQEPVHEISEQLLRSLEWMKDAVNIKNGHIDFDIQDGMVDDDHGITFRFHLNVGFDEITYILNQLNEDDGYFQFLINIPSLQLHCEDDPDQTFEIRYAGEKNGFRIRSLQ